MTCIVYRWIFACACVVFASTLFINCRYFQFSFHILHFSIPSGHSHHLPIVAFFPLTPPSPHPITSPTHPIHSRHPSNYPTQSPHPITPPTHLTNSPHPLTLICIRVHNIHQHIHLSSGVNYSILTGNEQSKQLYL